MIKLVPTQPVYHLGTLQDGKHPPSWAPDPGGGLDGKNRPQGCILFGSNSQGPSEMAPFSLARPELPVLLPSIQPVLSSLLFTKITRPIVAWLRQLGVKLIVYIDNFLLLAQEAHTSSIHDHCIASIGDLDQQQEIHPNTLSGNIILRSDGSLSPPTLHLPQYQLQILKSKTQ